MVGIVMMTDQMAKEWFRTVLPALPPAMTEGEHLWLGVCEEHYLLGTVPTTERCAQEWVDQHIEFAHTAGHVVQEGADG